MYQASLNPAIPEPDILHHPLYHTYRDPKIRPPKVLTTTQLLLIYSLLWFPLIVPLAMVFIYTTFGMFISVLNSFYSIIRPHYMYETAVSSIVTSTLLFFTSWVGIGFVLERKNGKSMFQLAAVNTIMWILLFVNMILVVISYNYFKESYDKCLNLEKVHSQFFCARFDQFYKWSIASAASTFILLTLYTAHLVLTGWMFYRYKIEAHKRILMKEAKPILHAQRIEGTSTA